MGDSKNEGWPTRDNIERVYNLLGDAGYKRSYTYDGPMSAKDPQGNYGPHCVVAFNGPGPTILVQVIAGNRGGFEVFAPVTDSLKVDDTLRALVERIAAAKSGT